MALRNASSTRSKSHGDVGLSRSVPFRKRLISVCESTVMPSTLACMAGIAAMYTFMVEGARGTVESTLGARDIANGELQILLVSRRNWHVKIRVRKVHGGEPVSVRSIRNFSTLRCLFRGLRSTMGRNLPPGNDKIGVIKPTVL